ncbi:MAG: hypothetical protein V1745_04920 [Patescibacteria group bacterium]
MAKRNVSEIETGAGYFMGVVNATMDVVREKGVPFAAIYRLATAGGRTTLGRIVDLAHADWQAEQPKPTGQDVAEPHGGHPYRSNAQTDGDTPFSVMVVYALPLMHELKRRFPGYVNPAYDGIVFKPIKVCEKVSRETREVKFEYVHLGRDASNEEVLAEMDKRVLRPALPEELLAFDAKYPEEMMKYPIVALGSETFVSGDRNVACLWSDGNGRNLDLAWFDGDWSGRGRFLAVRK